MRTRWVVAIVVLGGVVLGLAVAGPPSRRQDPALAVQAAPSGSGAAPTSTVAPPPSSSTTAALRATDEIRVMAFNSSGTAGAATRVGTRVKAQGYKLQTPGPDRKPPQATTVIMYRAGYEGEARALATALGLDPGVAQPMNPSVVSAGDTDLAVLVGNDLARRTG